jgi:hypothetical protein
MISFDTGQLYSVNDDNALKLAKARSTPAGSSYLHALWNNELNSNS